MIFWTARQDGGLIVSMPGKLRVLQKRQMMEYLQNAVVVVIAMLEIEWKQAIRSGYQQDAAGPQQSEL